MPTVAEHYNSRIQKIWEKYPGALRRLSGGRKVPLFIPEIAVDIRVVYSGINPSFNQVAVRKFAREAGCDMHYFKWNANVPAKEFNSRVSCLQNCEAIARTKYKSYFGPLAKLSDDIGVSYKNTTHLDLLAIRAGSQSILRKELERCGGNREVVAFVEEQKHLYSETLQKLSPRIVLVVNAQASRWLRDHLGLVPSTDRRTYRWSNIPKTTFILSSQLSGGATNEFARDRLVADLKMVLKPAREFL